MIGLGDTIIHATVIAAIQCPASSSWTRQSYLGRISRKRWYGQVLRSKFFCVDLGSSFFVIIPSRVICLPTISC